MDATIPTPLKGSECDLGTDESGYEVKRFSAE